MRGQEENKMLERVTKEIDDLLDVAIYGWKDEEQSIKYGTLEGILSTKAGNHTLKELIEMIDKGELVRLAKDKNLPELPHPLKHSLDFRDGALRGMEDMLKADFCMVEPLK